MWLAQCLKSESQIWMNKQLDAKDACKRQKVFLKAVSIKHTP